MIPVQNSPPPVREELPTRWRAFLFFAKACLFRLRRALRDPLGRKPARFPRAEIHTAGRVIAESRTPLFTTALEAEFALQAGKVQNLRRTAAHLHGVVIPAGEVFSFWAHVPRPTRGRGFAPGRELREGCVIPSIGGGLCQFTNALYDVALKAGCEIVERHAHSRRLPGSAAEAGRDATVFWNYVDLRFRAPAECQLEITLTRWELVVRIRQISADVHGAAIAPTQPVITPAPALAAESCETCGVTDCFQNPAATSLPKRAATAFLVDAWWPEHDAYISKQRQSDDWLLTPLDSRRWRIGPYRWNSAGFAKVRQVPFFVAKRALISRRLAAQGPARQQAQLALDEALARHFARLIPYTALHVVVSQNLLPFLWRDGVLAGRSFDVLMTRLPLAALHAQLDLAAQRWPDTATLTDFRAPESIVSAESAALAEGRRWITPHSAIARLAGRRALRLPWMLPDARRREPGRRVIFPASDLPRKGALDLREVAREELLPLVLAGSAHAPREFWAGCNIARTNGDWLADAAAVVLPAWVENQPRRLLAAVAAGIPVLASEACGLEDVAGVTTFPCGDTAALRDAIAGVFLDRMRGQIGDAQDGALASSPATSLPRAALF